MSEVVVNYKGGIGFEVKAREHSITIDLEKAMNPPEVFIASLGACIGVYVVRYLQNTKLDPTDMSVRLDWSLSDDKKMISEINARIALPHAELGKREKAVLEVAHHCLIHNTILGAPLINLTLEKS
jgi:uncharacterized OsmC-like protein